MATTDASTAEPAEQPDEAQQIRERLESIAGLEVEQDLVRARQLGEASFAGSRALFDATVANALRLRHLPWHRLTRPQAAAILNHTTWLHEVLKQVKAFTVRQNDPIAARDNLAGQVAGMYEQFRARVIPLVGYLSWETINLDEMRRQVEEVVRATKEQADQVMAELDKRREEAETVLTAIRGAATAAGVAHHAEVFKGAADRHDAKAWKWLLATVLTGVVTVILAIGLVWVWDADGDISDAAVFQVVVSKGIILAVGLYLTVTFVRLYRSHAHPAIVNRHREDALRTYRAFAEGTGDTEVKDKVLLEATHTIFAPAETGLIDGRGGTDSIELLDGVTGLIRRRGP